MTEKFLHYLWKLKRFRLDGLRASGGEAVQIIRAGDHNFHAGPDFLNARLKIGNEEWAGTVEIHVKASEWNLHHHDKDLAYNNVILHVVYENDRDVFHEDGTSVACLEIRDHIDSTLFESYSVLMKSEAWIPCANQISEVGEITIIQLLHRMMVERLEEKIRPIEEGLARNGNNWEDTFYHSLSGAFGSKINTEPFIMLAQALPLKILSKHKSSLFQIEALLFGMAGFLNQKFLDEYPEKLRKEFEFLKKKYGLEPLKNYMWKFLRLRPANFPTLRIAQFASLVFNSTHLISKIIENNDPKKMRLMFECGTSEYWNSHYRFDTPSAEMKKVFGRTAVDLLMINTVAPFLFVYGKLHDETHYMNLALGMLEQLPPEENTIIRLWKETGVTCNSAFASQALLQLKNSYCSNFRCLDCAVGNKILAGAERDHKR